MLSFFKSRPLIEETNMHWLIDTFKWGLENFGREEFFERSILVQPTNDFFPGRVDSVEALAENVFKHTVKYAGVSHFPFVLQQPDQYQGLQPNRLGWESITRNSVLVPAQPDQALTPWYITYNPHQTLKPEDLSSTFAHVIAQHLAFEKGIAPPGGEEFFNQATEVLAIVMGFGVMMVNSAHTYRGGCGSCYNPFANRKSSLYEDDSVFVLALYCHLKNIDKYDATRCLKKHLKGTFKRANKQISDNVHLIQKLVE